MNGHLLHGYHCTRLTEPEIQNIMLNGMQLPNKQMLDRRIQSIQGAGLIESYIATRLKNENQAICSNRAEMIWFCFYRPYIAGQSGIQRLFRSWGGEALYNSHEKDPQTGPILKSIGTPCLIEANVPIADLGVHSTLCEKVARLFLIKRGLKKKKCVDHDDKANSPILSRNIKRIIQYPDPDFIALTHCNKWSPPL